MSDWQEGFRGRGHRWLWRQFSAAKRALAIPGGRPDAELYDELDSLWDQLYRAGEIGAGGVCPRCVEGGWMEALPHPPRYECGKCRSIIYIHEDGTIEHTSGRG